MGKSVLIASGKGGVGKSTLAVSLGASLAARGKSCVLVDGDVGLRCADLLLGLQDQVVYDMADLLEDDCELEEVLYPVPCAGSGKLFLLPASQTLRASELKPKQMLRLAERLRERFDLVLFDGPAGIGRNMKILMPGAQECLLVATPDDVALRDGEKVSTLLDGQELGHPGLILNRVRKEWVKLGLISPPEETAERLDMPLIGIIPESARVYPALLKGKQPYECGDRAFREAVDDAADRLLGKTVPFPKMAFSPVYRFFHRADES